MEKIDKLDRQILEIISQNARIPFKDVATECGVSRAARSHAQGQGIAPQLLHIAIFGRDEVAMRINNHGKGDTKRLYSAHHHAPSALHGFPRRL